MRIPSSRARAWLRLSFFDVLWALATPWLALLMRDPELLKNPTEPGLLIYCVASAAFSALFFWVFRIRAPLPSFFASRDAAAIVKAATGMLLATFVTAFVFTRLEGVPRSTPLIHWLLLVGGLLAARVVGRAHFAQRDLVRVDGAAEAAEQIIVIGANAISAAFIALLEACATRGSHVAAILDPRPQMRGREIGGVRILGAPHELEAVVSEFEVHGVRISRVLIAGAAEAVAVGPLLAYCDARRIPLDTIPAIAGLAPEPLSAAPAGIRALTADLPADPDQAPPARMAPFEASAATRLKRLLDLVAVSLGLLALAPLMLVISVGVLCAVGAPVLFWQQRQGRHGRPFHVYKFRTLRAPYAACGRALSAAERRSAFGDFLRRAHLDELPQLFSVLRGDMSLVGPRPLLPVDQPDETTLRLTVPPGLTGWAQLGGGKLLTPSQKGVLDDWYVRNWSLGLDFEILARTVAVVLRGGSTDEFMGDASEGPDGRTKTAAE